MKTLLKIAGAAALFGIICVLCASWAPAGEGNGHWYSIVPPLLAITMAFLTRHVLLSLGAAVFVGGILSVVPQAPMDIHIWFKGVATAATYIAGTFGETGNLQLLTIFPAIFSMIAIIVASGGFLGVINWLLRWVKGRKSAHQFPFQFVRSLQHVCTQLPYSLIVAAFALTCGYIPSSFGLGRGWNITLAVVIMGTFFVVLARRKK